ncbi:dienelactone hydrolase family protein [Bradyrhizobium sp. SZCCHNRI2049]|uniref:dienelactone hydrolase family protein n=1 Tax=Bradyrhizobium sp. SZCCHNRI2049 TaxID=3057287 RepID=UPI00291634BF|nr:dienelactone hydrolase family protein [Bradyrhizobium sp. SZCCHNRI2049]
MATMSRRIVLSGLAALALPLPARAGSPQELSADDAEGKIALSRYAADGEQKRPAVLVLHGARGVELKPLAYERYARALIATGIDVYLVRYYADTDATAFDQRTTTRESRDALYPKRFDAWVRRVFSVATMVLARPESSGRIGLLGFSLGSFVAADTAAHDNRITALAAMYGGMPDAMVSQVRHMPPLIELHGDADHNVPLAKGKELVELAKSVGAPAEQIVYPGKQHGFDFSDNDPATADAIQRVVHFFHQRLLDGSLL